MLQIIITLIIVFAAALIALTWFVRFFTGPPEKCGGCSQSCGGCSLEELYQNSNFTTKTPRHKK
jgi:hypothetical protein